MQMFSKTSGNFFVWVLTHNALRQLFLFSFLLPLFWTNSLCEKSPKLEFFWSVFSHIWTEVSLRIQSKCGNIRTRKTPNTDTFHAVNGEEDFFEFVQYVANWSVGMQDRTCFLGPTWKFLFVYSVKLCPKCMRSAQV